MPFDASRTTRSGVAALAAALLLGCQQGGTALSPPDGLAGLPLTPASRAQLAADLAAIDVMAAIDAMNTSPGCTEREIAFVKVSLTAFAVGVDESLTEPWTASETARLDALLRRWEALGGDAGGVSAACGARLAALDLPIR